MSATVLTIEDLEAFKNQLLAEIKSLLASLPTNSKQRWLKSHQVRRLLTISPGTLQHLRITGVIPFTKLGGVIFYDLEDIQKILIERKIGGQSSR
ncbi:MerR family transcriptional regulator [Pseudochryseolinea flava]|uniref:DNA-binding protein n=1 Tax=Pseudochryseolinea flava TaxID=2059302 RepID=A0A364Y5E8_9BACT|nr:helix-turn-helix domain-containing protein [Pseudochryseolinea flava]RAW01581.1 DNA-binding protein [Pseudochryseolinea flava]